MPWAHAPWNILQEGRDAEDAEAGHCVHDGPSGHFGQAGLPSRSMPADAPPEGVSSPRASARAVAYSIVVERLERGDGPNPAETRLVLYHQRLDTMDLQALIQLVNKIVRESPGFSHGEGQ